MSVLTSVDTALFESIAALPHPPWLSVLMTAATVAGRAATIWVALAVWLAVRDDPGAAWRVLLALLVTYSVVDGLLKPTFDRARPHAFVVEHPLDPSDSRPESASFPSGHAAGAAAGAFGLSRVWRRATPALWILAVLIASSRVYLGVHYPADVVAGLGTGWACAYFVTGGMVYPATDARAPTASR